MTTRQLVLLELDDFLLNFLSFLYVSHAYGNVKGIKAKKEKLKILEISTNSKKWFSKSITKIVTNILQQIIVMKINLLELSPLNHGWRCISCIWLDLFVYTKNNNGYKWGLLSLMQLLCPGTCVSNIYIIALKFFFFFLEVPCEKSLQ